MLGKPASASTAASPLPSGEPLRLDGLNGTTPHFTTSRGSCRPFGATLRPGGINFAVFSRHATRIDLVLFKEGQEEPLAEIALDPIRNRTGDVWHVFVHGLGPEIQYGYRAHGPLTPRAGHRFNPRTVLLDPYAPALSGGPAWGQPELSLGVRLPRRSRLVVDDFDWEGDVPPARPMAETILYELHVRGFTRHPSSGVKHPGTFLGLCDKIAHLQELGVTAVQLMPVLEFDELEHHGPPGPNATPLRNYWGYAPLSFFALKGGYAASAGQQVREFKEMVRTFHRAGLEVILDVVFNHTAEGNENGPTMGFRGLDNAIYYLLDREGRYHNFSGCGNTISCNHPVVRELILDSLTYLVSELHVDGFRFDLASILSRGPDGKVLEDPPLLRHIAEHPVLARTKLIAEAWDAAGLWQQGKFPAWGRWAELNGCFRDDVRKFVRGDPGLTAALAKRLCGSLDLYGEGVRPSQHSVNFITCHDGFTLYDLVSYNAKHNEANGENNKDGWDWNFSCNHGVEGPTTDAAIEVVRQRQMRNFLTLLLIAQGVPLLSQGDELGRTQKGNNNAYCQDNEISWVDWGLAEKNAGLLRFTKMMIALRQKYIIQGRESLVQRLSWHGTKLGEPDWTGQKRLLAFHLQGGPGRPDLYAIFNAHWEWQRFHLPPREEAWPWKRLVDTNLESPHDIVEETHAVPLKQAADYVAAPRSAVILLGSRG